MNTQFSETMGSFTRTGNYPLEAYYIFPTEEALKEFYSDEINATTIHKGLLKIVENDGTGKQGLYWVTKKQTNDELEFTKLISGDNVDEMFTQLENLETRLSEEIKNRQDSETAIWGTNDPTNVPEELNSLLDLANVIVDLKLEISSIHSELVDSDDSIYKSLKTEVKALAGTTEYDVVEYLKTLPYKNLTEVSNALNKFLNETDATSNQINTLPELKFFLEGYTDTDKLRHVLLDLQAEILGDPLPTQDFRTLRAIEDFVRILKADSENTDKNIQSEIDNTQIGVGLSGDGSYNADKETYYLGDATSIMNALKILDSLMYEAISGITIETSNTDVVDLAVRKELEGYVLSAKLNLSNQLGNDLIKKEDGLYFNVDSTYNDGVLSLYVNGKLVAQHILGFSSIVDSAQYDSALEAIIIVFKLLSGEKLTITIPVGALIREWDVDNSQADKVVELTRNTVIDGQDTLSADVRLWSDKSNILRKYGNTLGVEGTTDNITHNDETLKVFLETLKTTVTDNNSTLNNKIDSEISRATVKEAAIESDLSDLNNKIDSSVEDLNDEIAATNNAIKAEVNRAVAAENSLITQVEDLKTADSELRQTNELQNTKISSLEKEVESINYSIELEKERATNEEDKINTRIDAVEGELSTTSAELQSEINRATQKETDLSQSIIEETSRASAKETELNSLIKSEETRAENAEGLINTLIEDLRDLINANSDADGSLKERIAQVEKDLSTESSRAITEETKLDSKIDLQKQELLLEIHLVSDEVSDMIADKADKSDIEAIQTKVDSNAEKISQEIVRATTAEGEIQASINNQVSEINNKINDNSASISTLNASVSKDLADMSKEIVEVSKEISSKIGSVQLEKVNDLTWNLLVDGNNVGQINVPEDQFLESVNIVNDTIMRFVFKTNTGTITTDINIENIISSALSELEAKIDEKAPIYSPTFTGIPQVETSPDDTDSSQRIPSTNWVRARIQEEVNKISFDNFFTKEEIRELLASKADLIDGIVPESQLPKLYIIEVE